MRPTTLVHLYRIRLRARLVPELLALTGIGIGVALVFAALVASASLIGSVRQLSDGIVGRADFQLAARSPAGFDQRILGRVRAVDGVEAAAAVVESRANLTGPRAVHSILLVGGDPRFGSVGGPLLQSSLRSHRHSRPGLLLPSPLAADLGVGTGGETRVETGARTTTTKVVGLLGRDRIGSLAESPVALAPLPLAREMAGLRGRVSRVFVKSAPGRQRDVEAALRKIAEGRLNVTPADQEVATFERASYPTNQATALFSVLSALVGFLFASSATLLIVPQRRRLIADLRMNGYGPRAVMGLLLFDATMLGVAGSALGLLLGNQVSQHLFGAAPGYLTSAFAIGSQRVIDWQSIAIPVVLGILAACVSVLAPIRDALSAEAKAPSAMTVSSRREAGLTAAGCTLLLLTAAIVVFWPQAALIGIAAPALALLLLLPALMRASAAGLDRLGRRAKSPIVIFAMLELRSASARVRTLALVATGAVAVFATVAIGGARADLQRGLDAVPVDAGRSAEVWVTFSGPTSILGTTPFAIAPEQLAALERLPGVRRVNRNGGGLLDVGDHRAWVQAPSRTVAQPLPERQIRAGDAALAENRVRRGGWLTLSEDIAAELGVGLGDRVTVPSPVPKAFRVAALTTNVGWPGGAIEMNATDFFAAWGADRVSSLGIVVREHASPLEVARSVRGVLGPQSPLSVETRAERIRRQQAMASAGFSRLRQIAALVLAAAVLAMGASMGGVLWQRRPTLATLKAHGADELELWLSLLLESSLLLGAGCLFGAFFGLLGQIVLDQALQTITGFPVFYELAAPVALEVLLLVSITVVAILAVPGWLAVRVRPMATDLGR